MADLACESPHGFVLSGGSVGMERPVGEGMREGGKVVVRKLREREGISRLYCCVFSHHQRFRKRSGAAKYTNGTMRW